VLARAPSPSSKQIAPGDTRGLAERRDEPRLVANQLLESEGGERLRVAAPADKPRTGLGLSPAMGSTRGRSRGRTRETSALNARGVWAALLSAAVLCAACGSSQSHEQQHADRHREAAPERLPEQSGGHPDRRSVGRSERGLLEQAVGDRQQRGAAHHKQDAVEQRQPTTDRGARNEHPLEPIARRWADHHSMGQFRRAGYSDITR